MRLVVGSEDGASKHSLTGLSTFALIIEDFLPDADIADDPLAKGRNETFVHDMRALVEQRLKGSPITLVSEEAIKEVPGTPYLYVNAYLRRTKFSEPGGGGEELCVVAVVLEVYQRVRLDREPRHRVLAPTWSSNFMSVVPLSQMRSTLVRIVEERLTIFLSVLDGNASQEE